ncbi:aminotransferase [Alkalihalobacillus alcalophilus ATCC 27647 = CGMCC 1.3604]|uniref:Aminotransferase n=1 Tax=Alkalihalobacillus alcalophilus ATCC 27647 = CGMCC 1.3604 TaxID=1218173 RepID=A0A094WKM2_ALKAL|nr:aminotransferase class I/II-fold pyridoxal phosphate-dependent enzyme [Alkalihalobacillus alcalophilus]KGA97406.1 aminotransferase [Alkalihalobacillus alcalophilus ATCC 27647 = CGMCC 1.3604]MED1561799.1 aminotransferase class I/II-fold pyridoxal phosphate-dependent enzyme [Alkalihalobacillus alcalophilus]THG90765.1 aminotransferase [Alkalihalobacillus alcalophilus ATCC 27647 = CGMCC 1.3604]
MTEVNQLNKSELEEQLEQLKKKYESYKEKELALDMSRGKPCPEQVDLSRPMLDLVTSEDLLKTDSGVDVRNYGGLDGLAEAKEFFAPILGVAPAEVIIGGNSSLTMMHDTIARAMLFGVVDSEKPWSKLEKVKFICPSPGYDRHFAICELFGIEMITVDLLEDGPDMDKVEELVKEDATIKGIWCVPKYSNPMGNTFSDEIVNRLAKMETKANDFRIFWDNAYAIHHLTLVHDKLKNIYDACVEAGNENRVFLFASTSKVTFPGAGVAAMAASPDNVTKIKSELSIQTIGPDKMNQLRHVRFFEKEGSLEEHMKKHAELIKPKFDKTIELFEKFLGGKGIATWLSPVGGYFISIDTLDGCAKEVVALAKEAGVTLTGAGATYPYGKDPYDSNIRIAPTFPSLDELEVAIEIFCLCVEIVSIEKKLAA